ncbi:MAG: GNAT family N-acetyltransferase [Rhodothermales bacterium]
MTVRLATLADIPALRVLIKDSVRTLGARQYDAQQIESSLRYLFGVDTTLIDDETYFVTEEDEELVGCGGWSKRQTPFGGDHAEAQNTAFRNPATDPAVIRAFFVHPDHARRGIGRMLLHASEQAALDAGFRQIDLVATLSGQPFYETNGYRAVEPVPITLPDGVFIQATRMVRTTHPTAADATS